MRRVDALLLGTIAVLLSLAACSRPFKTPVFNATDAPEFRGVGTLMKESGQLDLLLVHGMCTHDKEWATTAISDLNAALGGTDPVDPVRQSVPGTEVLLYQQTLKVPTGTLRANAVVWSPVVAPLKRRLCYDRSSRPAACKEAYKDLKPYPYERAALNRAFKDVMMNDCLADAMIYQGRSRDIIRDQLKTAIAFALHTSGGGDAPRAGGGEEEAPLVIITESLGSKMTFDAVNSLLGEPGNSVAAGSLMRTAQIFMEANQMPILALADATLPGKTAEGKGVQEAPDPVAQFAKKLATAERGKSRAPGERLRVVAFSDPNDVLSYALINPDAPVDYEVVDAIVSNATTYFGCFENPLPAHQGYGQTSAVRRLLACGHPAADCGP